MFFVIHSFCQFFEHLHHLDSFPTLEWDWIRTGPLQCTKGKKAWLFWTQSNIFNCDWNAVALSIIGICSVKLKGALVHSKFFESPLVASTTANWLGNLATLTGPHFTWSETCPVSTALNRFCRFLRWRCRRRCDARTCSRSGRVTSLRSPSLFERCNAADIWAARSCRRSPSSCPSPRFPSCPWNAESNTRRAWATGPVWPDY